MSQEKAATPVLRGQREAIRRHLDEFVVERWLGGSTLKMDRPTLAQVRAAGYDVVRQDNTDSQFTEVQVEEVVLPWLTQDNTEKPVS